MFINSVCVYKHGLCLGLVFTNWDERGAGGLGLVFGPAPPFPPPPPPPPSPPPPSPLPPPPPVSSHRAATPSTASSVVFLSFCPQPPIPLTIPTHHAPHSKNQARAGTISTNHTALSFRPCELLIESCIFLWFQGFGLYTDRRDVHIKDSRKDGRHTASWTRRIPGSLILTSIIVYFTFQ